MATSSPMNTSNQYIKYTISITQNSQNITNNTSNVTVSVRFYRTNVGYETYGTGTVYCKINGTTYSAAVSSDQKITNAGIVLFKKTLNITHNTNGTKTLATSAWINHSRFTSSEQSYSQTLTTIPRATTPTFSASSVDMGNSVTITLNRASSGFTHSLSYSFGSLTGQTAGLSATSGIATSATFTPPLTLSSQIPNTTSGVCTITCKTYSGSTLIGTKTATISLRVPTSVIPVINSVSITEATEGIMEKFAAFVQSKTKLSVSISASGVSGSTITGYETYIQAVPYRGESFVSDVITASGTIDIVTRVTDSRGRTAELTNNVTIIAYSRPQISEFSAWRIDTGGSEKDDGNRIGIKANFSISPVGNRNDHTFAFKYKQSNNENFTTFSSGFANWTFDDTQLFTSSPNVSPDYAYNVRIEISDFFETVVFETQISSSFSVMDFRNTGKGMAIGKASEKDALEIAMDTEFTKKLKVFSEDSGITDDGYLRLYNHNGDLMGFLTSSDDGEGARLHFYQNGERSGVVKFNPDGTIAPMGTTMVDHIIEQGKSGIWNYEKWYNGKCEIWGVLIKNNVAITTSQGSGYYSSAIDTDNLPFSIVAGSAISTLTAGQAGIYCTGYNLSTQTTKLQFRANANRSYTGDITVYIHLIGRWKE